MMTEEARVKLRVKEILKNYACYQYWPVTNGMGAPTLDCIGCYKTKFFSIETKAPGKHPTPRQEVTMKAMRDAGAAVFVVDGSAVSYTALINWLEVPDVRR